MEQVVRIYELLEELKSSYLQLFVFSKLTGYENREKI